MKKKIIQDVFKQWQSYNADKQWEPILEQQDVTILEHSKVGIKTESILQCCPVRLFKLWSDVFNVTRDKWDRACHFGLGTMRSLRVLETLLEESERLYFIEFRLVPTNANYDVRYFQGLFWVHSEHRMCIFKSLRDEKYKCPPECVYAEATQACMIRKLEDQRCYMSTMLMDCKYGGTISKTIDCASIYEQIKFTETIAMSKIYTVYDVWKCCSKWHPPHALQCNICMVGRHGRCADMNCLEPCKDGAKKCTKCGSGIVLN